MCCFTATPAFSPVLRLQLAYPQQYFRSSGSNNRTRNFAHTGFKSYSNQLLCNYELVLLSSIAPTSPDSVSPDADHLRGVWSAQWIRCEVALPMVRPQDHPGSRQGSAKSVRTPSVNTIHDSQHDLSQALAMQKIQAVRFVRICRC